MGLRSSKSATLGTLNSGEQALNAWFQATVPRSSGFNTIDTGAMTNSSSLLMMLMFIGGGSLSTAGGIKVEPLSF